MVTDVTEEKYEYAQSRIVALLPIISEETSKDDPPMMDTTTVTDVVGAYEGEHGHAPYTLGEIIYDAWEDYRNIFKL